MASKGKVTGNSPYEGPDTQFTNPVTREYLLNGGPGRDQRAKNALGHALFKPVTGKNSKQIEPPHSQGKPTMSLQERQVEAGAGDHSQPARTQSRPIPNAVSLDKSPAKGRNGPRASGGGGDGGATGTIYA